MAFLTFSTSPATLRKSSSGLRRTSLCPASRLRRPSSPRCFSLSKMPTMKTYDVEIDMEGQRHTIPIDDDQTLLEGIEDYGLEVKYSCRAGVCTTCAAKILKGEVDLGQAAISQDLKDQGYVLTCSGFPRSEGILLEMNHFDDAYEMQYGQFEKGKGISK